MPYSEADAIRHHVLVDPLFLSGGMVLTFIAGFINTTSLMYFQVPVSHMSGVVSKISIDVAAGDQQDIANLLFIFLGFFAGAMVSGYLIGVGNLKPKIEYAYVLLMEGLSLLAALFLFRHHQNNGLLFVSFACGLQNAMASSYLGLIVRTTHVTGIVTDLAILLGQAAKHKRVKKWKFVFLASLLGGFFAGGVAAMLAYSRYSFYTLLLPSMLCIAASAVFYLARVRPRKKILDGLENSP